VRTYGWRVAVVGGASQVWTWSAARAPLRYWPRQAMPCAPSELCAPCVNTVDGLCEEIGRLRTLAEGGVGRPGCFSNERRASQREAPRQTSGEDIAW
jgi:hypothetical protein